MEMFAQITGEILPESLILLFGQNCRGLIKTNGNLCVVVELTCNIFFAAMQLFVLHKTLVKMRLFMVKWLKFMAYKLFSPLQLAPTDFE